MTPLLKENHFLIVGTIASKKVCRILKVCALLATTAMVVPRCLIHHMRIAQ